MNQALILAGLVTNSYFGGLVTQTLILAGLVTQTLILEG